MGYDSRGGTVSLAWEGHFRDYELRCGMRVPSYGEVGWYVGDVWQPVWQGRITAYDARRASSVAGDDPVASRAHAGRPSER